MCEHCKHVKQILRYPHGTLSCGCSYRVGGETYLVGYSDSDFAGYVDAGGAPLDRLLPRWKPHHMDLAEAQDHRTIFLQDRVCRDIDLGVSGCLTESSS